MSTNCSVTLSANAGVSVTFTRGELRRRIWIDAAHRGKIVGFSTIYEDLWSRVKADENFPDPDVMFYTHCHGDHFSKRMAEEAARLWPKAALILPEDRLDHSLSDRRLLLSGPRILIGAHSLRDLSLDIVRVPHEGERFAHVPHYGIFISFGGVTVFASGDCALGSAELLPYLKNRRVDLAILAFPWITLRRGRKYLDEYMKPAHILAYHLPFEEDDVNGYRAAAAYSASSYKGTDVRLLENALQTEYYEF